MWTDLEVAVEYSYDLNKEGLTEFLLLVKKINNTSFDNFQLNLVQEKWSEAFSGNLSVLVNIGLISVISSMFSSSEHDTRLGALS